jgi:CoA-transferase family III/Fumarylacetoacetate (FAA) hydrolase family
MLDTMVSFLWPEAMTQYTVVGREASTADPIARPDLIFETDDDYIAVGTVSDSEWRGFCAAAARHDLVEDPRSSTTGARAGSATERILLMGEIIKQRPAVEWLARLDRHDVPSAPVLRKITDCDLALCGMVAKRNGQIASLGVGAASMANPLLAVRWLAEKLAQSDRPLRAGDVVLSGSLGPIVPLVPGDVFEVEVAGFGQVCVHLEAEL